MTTEAKVGLFTMAGVVLFVAGVLTLGDVSFKHSYPLLVYFDNANGLPDKGPVKVAGVDVGRINGIGLEGRRARVTIQLNEGVEVRANARAHVASTGLIGSKYLELSLGEPPAPVLEPGAVIEGEKAFTFDDVMTKLGDLFQEDPGTGAMGDNLRVTVANLRKVSEALSGSIGAKEKEMGQIVDNIRALTAHLREITAERKEDVKVALAKLRSASERLDDILDRVQNGDGVIAKLVGDGEMGKDLKQTMTDVRQVAQDAQSVMGRIARIEVDWDYRQRYDFEEEQARPDLGVIIRPKPGKFYMLRGNNLGPREDRKDDPEADLEKKNTITAVLGKDFGPWTLYGGAIRSAGGGGVRFRPLHKNPVWSRRVELEAEAYDFPRDEFIQGRHLDAPIYNAGARVNVLPSWLWAGAQVEDIAERKNLIMNVEATFRDEDISYLLGLLGLAR